MKAGTVVLRRRLVNRLSGLAALLLGIVFVIAFVSYLGHGSWGEAAIVAPAACVLPIIGIRFLVVRVEIGADGLAVHNFLRNYRLKWSQVDALVAATRGIIPRPIGVKLIDGRTIRFSGISPGRREKVSVSDKWMNELKLAFNTYRRDRSA